MTIGLRTFKYMPYRGTNHVWSNLFWLTGSVPANNAAWLALIADWMTHEKLIYPSTLAFVNSWTYDDTTSAASHVYLHGDPSAPAVVFGTFAFTPSATLARFPGDCAATVRFTTGLTDTRGHPIYGRKYFHGGTVNPPDALHATYVTALQTFGDKLANATMGGTLTGRALVLKDGTDLSAAVVNPYVTTRTLVRRGKRHRWA